MSTGRHWNILKKYSLRLTVFTVVVALIVSCGPEKNDEEEFSMTSIPRLTKYYPQVDANGDTTYMHPPSEAFLNQYGDTFSTAALNGHVSVIQIFFASCEGICPVISGSMAAIQKEFSGKDEPRMISISVDPARDSVPVLFGYAQRFHCDSLQWNLLTGDKKKTYDLIRYGYLLPDIEPGNGGQEDFIHSDQLILLDRDNIIRGYYGGTDTAQVRMLIEDIHTLINQQ